MKYLGTYQSNLSTWHLQELMALLETAFQQGDYAGGQTFDQAALTKLREDGVNFGQLPTASAGQRVTDDSLNRPLDLLRARFAALLHEAGQFDERAARLLAVLEKDAELIDQLLVAARLEYWASTRPNVGASQDVMWDFGMGHGPVATDIPMNDPANGVVYTSRPPVVSLLTDQLRTGLAAPASIRTTPVKYMKWAVQTNGELEELYGADWTKLSVLETSPRVSHTQSPAVEPYNHPFICTGVSRLGSTPVYVRVQFEPRRNQVTRTVTVGTSFSLSAYPVLPDDVVVMQGTTLYNIGVHYTVSEEGLFTPLDLPATTPLTIWFLERYPAYQCSINQHDWSPVVMLDATRPYPDTETQFRPIAFGAAADGTRTALPVTDELGTPTGVFLELGPHRPTTEWVLKIAHPGSENAVGVMAQLEVEFLRPTYLNALQLAPFTTFPAVLTRIEVEGLTADTRASVYEGNAVLDRTTVLRFERRLTRRVFLTFAQENYTLKDYQLTSADALRREVMTGLQSALPYAVRRAPAAVPTTKHGAQYEFGFEALEGQDWTLTSGVFVSGPHRFTGCPEVLRVDVDCTGDVDLYLHYRAYNANGLKVDENLVGVPLVAGQTVIFPLADDLTSEVRTSVQHTDVYLKLVPRTTETVVERFLIQVATHV